MHQASLAYTFLARQGYRNMKVLKEGIPGWAQKKYPVEGSAPGKFSHRPYPQAVRDFEQRLRASDGQPASPSGGPVPAAGG